MTNESGFLLVSFAINPQMKMAMPPTFSSTYDSTAVMTYNKRKCCYTICTVFDLAKQQVLSSSSKNCSSTLLQSLVAHIRALIRKGRCSLKLMDRKRLADATM